MYKKLQKHIQDYVRHAKEYNGTITILFLGLAMYAVDAWVQYVKYYTGKSWRNLDE